jgi:flagella basal body P-ring formation protein FlgA
MRTPKKTCLSLRFLVPLYIGLYLFLCPGAEGAPAWDPAAVIKHYLKSHYPWSEIEILEIEGGEQAGKEKPVNIHVLQGPLGRAVFSLVFPSGERVVLSAYVRALDWAVLSRRPLKKGQVLEEEDLYRSLTDVRKMPQGTLTRLEAARGKALARSVAANTVLTETDLGDPPMVKKGQKVILFAAAPGLRITTTGEAGEDGYPGRPIRVINSESKKAIRGVLVDENHVRVEF